MARPMSVTDEEILEAAHAVMARCGSDGFTVSEVARRVGLSRAAITHRFKGVEELRILLLKQMSHTFEDALAQLKGEPGAAGLVEIAEFVGGWTGMRTNFTAYMLDYSANIAAGAGVAAEVRRGEALRTAVAHVMPPLSVGPTAAVDAFMAHLIGSLFAWQSTDQSDAADFLRERTQEWLKLAGIGQPARRCP